MPAGFGILDAVLLSIPFFLAIMGLVRGAPVELASCLGCLVGAAAAWAVGCVPLVHALGQPAGPLIALASGLVFWRLARALSEWLGFDTRWIDLGRIFDSLVGFSMGGLRGIALVSGACLAYAMVLVPMGLADPVQSVAYPLFLAVGSHVTSAVIAEVASGTASPLDTRQPFFTRQPQKTSIIPVPVSPPEFAARATPNSAPGAAFASLMRSIAPNSAAARLQPAAPEPVPSSHSDIPVRQLPVSLLETHHNILRPHGVWQRARRCAPRRAELPHTAC